MQCDGWRSAPCTRCSGGIWEAVVIKKALERLTVALLVAAMLAGAAYFCVRLYTTPLEQRFLSLTGELQVRARGMRHGMQDVEQSDFSSIAEIKEDGVRIGQIIAQLRDAYAGGGTLVSLVVPAEEVSKLVAGWDDMHKRLDGVLDNQAVLERVERTFNRLDDTTQSIMSHSQAIVQILLDKRAPAREIALATRQLLLAQQIDNHLHVILHPAVDFTKSADYSAVVKDTSLFERTLEAMLNGDAAMGVLRLTGTDAAQELRATGDLFRDMSNDVGKILEAAPVLLNVRRSADDLLSASSDFERAAAKLSNSVIDYQARHDTAFVAIYLLGVAAVFVLFLYGLAMYRAFKSQLEFTTAQSMRYKDVITRMRQSLERLARGEITPGNVEMRDGMEGVITPFNQATGRVRQTLMIVKTRAMELPSFIERIKNAVAGMVQASSKQIENTTTASGTMNRLLPAIESLSRQVSDSLRALDALKADCAASRGFIREAEAQMSATQRPIPVRVDTFPPQRVDGLIGEVGRLTKGVEQLSVMVLHLIIKAHGVGQQDHEPVPYANNALQIAHQCTEAADELSSGLAELRGEERQVPDILQPPGGEPASQLRLLADADKRLTLVDSTIAQINAVLQEMPRLLNEQGAAIVSVSDDMDKIHEYTMQLSNGSADVSRAIKRITDSVDHIRRDVDQYKITQ